MESAKFSFWSSIPAGTVNLQGAKFHIAVIPLLTIWSHTSWADPSLTVMMPSWTFCVLQKYSNWFIGRISVLPARLMICSFESNAAEISTPYFWNSSNCSNALPSFPAPTSTAFVVRLYPKASSIWFISTFVIYPSFGFPAPLTDARSFLTWTSPRQSFLQLQLLIGKEPCPAVVLEENQDISEVCPKLPLIQKLFPSHLLLYLKFVIILTTF